MRPPNPEIFGFFIFIIWKYFVCIYSTVSFFAGKTEMKLFPSLPPFKADILQNLICK
jgi:hypothetical protein